MWHGEYFWSPSEIIGLVFAYTFFYTIQKVVLCRQLTKPKVVSLARPSLLKHFKGTANHSGHISVPSLQDWGWTSLRGEWRLSCIPLSEITTLRVKLVKYARKKGCSQKSDNRERQSQTLFFDYKYSSAWSIKSLSHRDIICSSSMFCIIAKSDSSFVMDYIRWK